jgi:hypothetical protein
MKIMLLIEGDLQTYLGTLIKVPNTLHIKLVQALHLPKFVFLLCELPNDVFKYVYVFWFSSRVSL